MKFDADNSNRHWPSAKDKGNSFGQKKGKRWARRVGMSSFPLWRETYPISSFLSRPTEKKGSTRWPHATGLRLLLLLRLLQPETMASMFQSATGLGTSRNNWFPRGNKHAVPSSQSLNSFLSKRVRNVQLICLLSEKLLSNQQQRPLMNSALSADGRGIFVWLEVITSH